MKNKHKIMLVSIVVAGLVGLMGYGYMVQQNPKAFLVFAVGSQPDIYGNKIRQVGIHQIRGGGQWYDIITYEEYQSGMTMDIVANYPTNIAVAVDINKTLCPGGVAQAKNLVRVYLSISNGVKTNELMTWLQSVDEYPGFYSVLLNSTSWVPATGVLYTVTTNYQAYY